ncbi:MAG TPA: hypothetical protein PK890_05095 [Terrimesophilobacter sp.]|mgnify:CR=1 FL=1|nr:hypothetical protein [Terrimesophilobacter sp.]
MSDGPNPSTLERIWQDILYERVRQENIHGGSLTRAVIDDDYGFALAVLTEEVGEVAQALLAPLASDDGNVREELIQVAAVAVAWLQALEHGGPGNG